MAERQEEWPDRAKFLGRENQEKKIVIDAQSDPEDQPPVQAKGKLVS